MKIIDLSVIAVSVFIYVTLSRFVTHFVMIL